jgi:shikimate kinase
MIANVVFLVGFMGAGKTTTGRLLAGKLGWSFLDLDDMIEEREGRKVPVIFAESGEAAFREAESAALEALLDGLESRAPLVVALGGGAFTQPRNAAALMASGAPVVFLDASVEELRRRCAPHGDTRPLFRDEQRFRTLYEERRAAYLGAGIQVDTSGKSAEQVADELIERLALDRQGAPENAKS